MKQRGFVQLSLLGWGVVLGAGTIVLLSGLLYVQTQRLQAAQAKHSKFVAEVKAKGEQQEAAAKAKAEADRKTKERTDAEIDRLRRSNAALARSLHDARARGSYLPPAAPGSERPDRACFDRTELERAVRQLDAEVSRIVEQGDQALIDLNAARAWAGSVSPDGQVNKSQ